MAILKAKIDGVWVDLLSGQDEVYVGANDPGAGYDLWYDTDEIGPGPPPRASVYRTTNLSVPISVETAVPFDSEFYDTNSMHDAVNPSRLTIPVAGMWAVGYQLRWSGVSSGVLEYLESRIRLNGTAGTNNRIGYVIFGGVNSLLPLAATIDLPLAAGDYLEVTVTQDNTTNIACNIDAVVWPRFWATYRGPL